MTGILAPVLGVLGSIGNIFSARENRRAQEEITEQEYIRYIGEDRLQEGQDDQILLIGVLLIISLLIFLISRK